MRQGQQKRMRGRNHRPGGGGGGGSGGGVRHHAAGGVPLNRNHVFDSNGPDVRVYLIEAPDASDNATVTKSGYLELGKLKGNEGDQNYEIPAGTDLSKFTTVSIYCERFNANFGAAPLEKF